MRRVRSTIELASIVRSTTSRTDRLAPSQPQHRNLDRIEFPHRADRLRAVIRRVALLATALLLFEVSCVKPKKAPGGIEMASRTSFVVGDFLVWQGQGLVRV